MTKVDRCLLFPIVVKTSFSFWKCQFPFKVISRGAIWPNHAALLLIRPSDKLPIFLKEVNVWLWESTWWTQVLGNILKNIYAGDIYQVISLPTGWLTYLLEDWLIDWIAGVIDRQTDKQTDWLTDWLTNRLTDSTAAAANWLTDWLTDSTAAAADWLTDWLTHRLTDQQQEIFQKISSGNSNESLTGFNIQASVMKIVTSERRESP